MASIVKHGDGWRAFVFKHGIRATKVLKTKRDAQAWALRKESELDAYAAGGGRTFASLAETYLKRVTPSKRSASWEERAIARLRDQIGDATPLASIDSALLGRWRDARLKSVSGSTVLREINLLRAMLRTASDEWRWQVGGGFRGMRMPAHNPPRQKTWPWKLIKRVLRAPRTGKTAEMQRAFLIALHTGLRLQEVLQHEYSGNVIILQHSKTSTTVERVPTTARARRHLPCPAFTVGANEGSVLFSRLCKELLIEGLTFHDARASALTWLSRRMDIMTLSALQATHLQARGPCVRAHRLPQVQEPPELPGDRQWADLWPLCGGELHSMGYAMTEKQDPPSVIHIAFTLEGPGAPRIRRWSRTTEDAQRFEQETGVPSHEYRLAGVGNAPLYDPADVALPAVKDSLTAQPEAIRTAIRLLRDAAQELAEGISINGVPDWKGEPETAQAYDETMAAVAALEAHQDTRRRWMQIADLRAVEVADLKFEIERLRAALATAEEALHGPLPHTLRSLSLPKTRNWSAARRRGGRGSGVGGSPLRAAACWKRPEP